MDNQVTFIFDLSDWFPRVTHTIFDKNYQTLTDAAASGGHTEILKWAASNGVYIIKTACNEAALGGHFDTLQWLKSIEYPWTETEAISTYAAVGGHTHILKWLMYNGCNFANDCCNNAAMSGNLECFQWLESQGIYWTYKAVDEAAKRGYLDILKYILMGANGETAIGPYKLYANAASNNHFEILKWGKENGIRSFCTLEDRLSAAVLSGNMEIVQWTLDTWKDVGNAKEIGACAVKSGNIKMLEWAKSRGCRIGTDAMATAASEGHIEILEWLINHNVEMTDYVCARAAGAGNLQVLKYLREKGCPWSDIVVENAVNGLHSDVAKWLIDNGCPIADTLCDTAASAGDVKTLKYLFEKGKTLSENFDYEEIGKCENLALFKLVTAQRTGYKWSQWIHYGAPNYEIFEWAYKQGCCFDSTKRWKHKLEYL